MANNVFANFTSTATALSNLALVTPQKRLGYAPQSKPTKNGQQRSNPPSLLFNYEGENGITLGTDITDNYTEDNSAIADNIALRPEEVTVVGYIGELNNVPANAALETLREIAERLTIINAYTPVLSATAIRAYNQATLLYAVGSNAVEAAVSAWATLDAQVGLLGLGSAQTKQQIFFQQFYGYIRSRTLFTVQTPWCVFTDMAVLSFRAVQPEETQNYSRFEITFKKIRTAQTSITPGVNPSNFEGRASAQASNVVDFGTVVPVNEGPLATRLTTSQRTAF